MVELTSIHKAMCLTAIDAVSFTRGPEWDDVRRILGTRKPFVFKREGSKWRVGEVGTTKLVPGRTQAVAVLWATLAARGAPVDGTAFVASSEPAKALGTLLRHRGVEWAHTHGLLELEALFKLVSIDADGSLRIDANQDALVLN